MNNMRSLKVTRGFTLIELMIAISILSLLLFTAGYSYSLLSSRWNHELGQFSSSAKRIKHLGLTQKLLEGVQSFIVVNDDDKPFFFFIGNNDSLLAVSQAGIYDNDAPEIFRLTALKKAEGSFDLIYQSTSTKITMLKKTNQNIEFTKTLILFSGLDNVVFNYYGWNHFDDKSNSNGANKQTWYSKYSGIDRKYMPSKMTLTLTMNGKDLILPISLQQDVEKWLSPYIEKDS
tara:strand:+ start:9023 stop:9718 length:696 start_codon:yes stop_codon:yes gene_type:complete